MVKTSRRWCESEFAENLPENAGLFSIVVRRHGERLRAASTGRRALESAQPWGVILGLRVVPPNARGHRERPDRGFSDSAEDQRGRDAVDRGVRERFFSDTG